VTHSWLKAWGICVHSTVQSKNFYLENAKLGKKVRMAWEEFRHLNRSRNKDYEG